MKQCLGIAGRIYPMPATIITAGSVAEPAGFTAAWINAIAGTPPTVVVGIRSSRNTLAPILESREFVINIMSTEQVAVVDFFGMNTGRSVDKFEACSLEVEQGAVVSAPALVQSAFHLECEISATHEIGEYVIVFARIVETCADESILDAAGEVDVERLDPLIYIPGAREYRALGAHVADAYSIGKTI